MNEVFELACPKNLTTRKSYLKFICPFRETNTGQNALSLIGLSLWNKTSRDYEKTQKH